MVSQADISAPRTVGGAEMPGLAATMPSRAGCMGNLVVDAQDMVIVGDGPRFSLFRGFVALPPLPAAPISAILQ